MCRMGLPLIQDTKRCSCKNLFPYCYFKPVQPGFRDWEAHIHIQVDTPVVVAFKINLLLSDSP